MALNLKDVKQVLPYLFVGLLFKFIDLRFYAKELIVKYAQKVQWQQRAAFTVANEDETL